MLLLEYSCKYMVSWWVGVANELYDYWSQREVKPIFTLESAIYKTRNKKILFHLPDLNEHFRY